MLRLYRAPFSTNVERVALALAHKGVPVESVWIDYADRGEVERVSGQGLVPVIDDEGTIVFDSPRILRHLEARHPFPPLFPADPARRAEMDVFIDWFNRVWKVWPNAIEAELSSPAPDEGRIEECTRELAVALDLFESLLAGRDFLFGDGLSAADCIAYPFLKYAAGREPEDTELFHRILEERQPLDGHPRLGAWIARVGALPRA